MMDSPHAQRSAFPQGRNLPCPAPSSPELSRALAVTASLLTQLSSAPSIASPPAEGSRGGRPLEPSTERKPPTSSPVMEPHLQWPPNWSTDSRGESACRAMAASAQDDNAQGACFNSHTRADVRGPFRCSLGKPEPEVADSSSEPESRPSRLRLRDVPSRRATAPPHTPVA